MLKSSWYKLMPDKTTVPISFEEKLQCGDRDFSYRRVGETIIGDVKVSTVFLEINHAFLGGPPILFETMIFNSKHEVIMNYQERCSTYQEALEMHKKAVEFVMKEGLK